MNAEIFRKTLEFSRQLRNSSQSSNRPKYPQTLEEGIKRVQPLIQALFCGKAKLANKTLSKTKY